MKTCVIDGCDSPVKSRGWCGKHWKRWKVHGSTSWEPPSDLDRFARFVAENTATGCWEWTGSIQPNGYATFTVKARNVLAHRFSYKAHIGPIQDGLQIDHLCRVRHCVNPDHMEPVTPRTNTLRSEAPAAANARKTHCVRGHALSGPNLKVNAYGHRVCLACRRLHSRRQSAARAASKVLVRDEGDQPAAGVVR